MVEDLVWSANVMIYHILKPIWLKRAAPKRASVVRQQLFPRTHKITTLASTQYSINAIYFTRDHEIFKQAVASRAFQPKEPYFERRGKTECFIGPETQFLEIL